MSVAKLFFKRCTIGSAKSGRETCCLLTRGICFYSNNIMIFLLPLSNACNKQSSVKHTYCLPCRIALHTVRILLLGSCIGQPIGFYYLFSNPCLQYVTLCVFFFLIATEDVESCHDDNLIFCIEKGKSLEICAVQWGKFSEISLSVTC